MKGAEENMATTKAQDCAASIAVMLNCARFPDAEVCQALLREHRTLQQSFTRLCKAWIKTLGEAPDACFDGRNEASRAFAKKLMPYIDEVSLPFI